ncbi:MAG: hypothetical protein [Caudoviricetes sp.]|nr:MAG: hypothetical protein [Caudoviricetes sp.]
MIDLEKEREEFIKVYTEIYGEHDQLWQGWKKRAKLAQAEINKEREKFTEYYVDTAHLEDEITELKQKLSEAHASRIEFVEYMRKIESGEFVLMPRKLSENMVLHAHKYHEGEPYLPYSLYESFVEAVENNNE